MPAWDLGTLTRGKFRHRKHRNRNIWRDDHNINAATASGGDIVGRPAVAHLIFTGPINVVCHGRQRTVRPDPGNVQPDDGGSYGFTVGITGPGTVSIGENNGSFIAGASA